ncbi:MAG: hypothetical protein Q9222_005938 [Ikaeria aurantiellina]
MGGRVGASHVMYVCSGLVRTGLLTETVILCYAPRQPLSGPVTRYKSSSVYLMIPSLFSMLLLVASAVCIPTLSLGHDHFGRQQPASKRSPRWRRQDDVVWVTSDQPTTRGSSNDCNTDSPLSGGESMIKDINYWRNKYGKKPLCWDQGMVDAAANTGKWNGGSGIAHHNPQYNAEVINPGSDTANGLDLKGHSPFEISYINWLCEGPHDNLGTLCKDQDDIMHV